MMQPEKELVPLGKNKATVIERHFLPLQRLLCVFWNPRLARRRGCTQCTHVRQCNASEL